MSESQLRFPLWQEFLLQAVMETNRDSLTEKIKIAETAIAERLRELEGNRERRPNGDDEERVALHDAISTLRTLKKILMEGQSRTAGA